MGNRRLGVGQLGHIRFRPRQGDARCPRFRERLLRAYLGFGFAVAKQGAAPTDFHRRGHGEKSAENAEGKDRSAGIFLAFLGVLCGERPFVGIDGRSQCSHPLDAVQTA